MGRRAGPAGLRPRPLVLLPLLLLAATARQARGGSAGGEGGGEAVVVRERPEAVRTKIYGGTLIPADSREFRFMSTVYSYDGRWYWPSCSGSLVRPGVVLTAAHCLWDGDKAGHPQLMQVSDLGIMIGYPDLDVASRADLVKVKSIHKHPAYDGWTNDLAVIILAGCQTDITPIKLAGPGSPYDKANQKVVALGYGKVGNFGESFHKLYKAETSWFEGDTCRLTAAALGFNYVPKIELCFGADGQGVCSGDSGGPVTVRTARGSRVQVGVTSFGSPVCGQVPDFAVRLSNYQAWLKEKTALDTCPYAAAIFDTEED